MKNLLIAGALVGVLTFGMVVYAQSPGGYGPGWGMGPGMMGGPSGQYGYPCGGPGMMGHGPGMMGGQVTPPQAQVTEENAKALAQQYADKYLKGYTVERVLPFTGMGGMTMYQAELKGPQEESRILRINPWGNVMPFGGPQARRR